MDVSLNSTIVYKSDCYVCPLESAGSHGPDCAVCEAVRAVIVTDRDDVAMTTTQL